MTGIVKEILITNNAGGHLHPVLEAKFVAGKGIEGDRYFNSTGTFSKALHESKDFEVTLIEQEEIDDFNHTTGLNYAAAAFRRNIITTDIRLNPLVGKELIIGNTTLRVVRLCEPCSYLSGLLGKEIMQHMVHKAGVRAAIISGGKINLGEVISSG